MGPSGSGSSGTAVARYQWKYSDHVGLNLFAHVSAKGHVELLHLLCANVGWQQGQSQLLEITFASYSNGLLYLVH